MDSGNVDAGGGLFWNIVAKTDERMSECQTSRDEGTKHQSEHCGESIL